jgi:hypothetical protein
LSKKAVIHGKALTSIELYLSIAHWKQDEKTCGIIKPKMGLPNGSPKNYANID